METAPVTAAAPLPNDGEAIELLVEEKACFLAMDIVNIVQDTVFADRHMAVQVRL